MTKLNIPIIFKLTHLSKCISKSAEYIFKASFIGISVTNLKRKKSVFKNSYLKGSSAFSLDINKSISKSLDLNDRNN